MARRRRISLVDLRLRSNEARRPFPQKPSGRRVFCPWPALARSLQPAAGRCAPPRPPWPQPASLAAAPLVVSKQALTTGFGLVFGGLARGNAEGRRQNARFGVKPRGLLAAR